MLQDAGEVDCESVFERLNAMEDAFRSEIDHLTEEMRKEIPRLFLERQAIVFARSQVLPTSQVVVEQITRHRRSPSGELVWEVHWRIKKLRGNEWTPFSTKQRSGSSTIVTTKFQWIVVVSSKSQ